MIQNKYGYFTPDHREYVITDPRTPRPWFNYMWNEHYAGLLSHTGGGFSYYDCSRDNRITRMRYNCLPWDRPGRYIIVKDIESGEYWSLSWAPTIDVKYDKYEAHVGQGYTTIITEYKGIRGELTYFVPQDFSGEIWKASLTDLTGRERKLEVYSFQELMMGNALNDIINQPNDKHFTDIHFNKEHQTLQATRRYWVLNKKSASVEQPNLPWGYNLFFTTNLPISGFDGSLDEFIGRWRSEANPAAIEESRMRNTEITAGDPVVALQSKITLASGEKKDFVTVMAVAEKEDENPYQTLNWDKITTNEVVAQKLQEVKDYWTGYLSNMHVNTPDEKFNAMINVWNQYQAAVTFDMARNSGYYHGGLLFGIGMRDQFQDIIGKVIAEPEKVRARLLKATSYQFADGSTLHNFFRLTGPGERTRHSDTPLWIPFGVVEYLNETGDLSILDEQVSFLDEGQGETYGTVLDHMIRALDFAIKDASPRGLPLIRKGDWNDTLDHIGPKGKGESLWCAMFLCYAMKKCFEVLDIKGEGAVKERWQKAYDHIAKVLNDECWDGEWYLRATRDNGQVVGSHKDKQGKIFINTLSWPIISGIAPKDRADSSIATGVKYMENKTGIQICYPSYTEVDDTMGLISRCVPGKKENGAVFNHASAWFVLAAIINGDKETAWRIYKKMIPLYSSEAISLDRYETEPYVYSEYVTSKDHPTEGQASHSWLTGSGVWMYRIAIDGILGIKTAIAGIRFEPSLPSEWDGATVTRSFRGKKLNITFKAVDAAEQTVTVNGETVPSAQWIDVNKYAPSTLEIEVGYPKSK